MVAVVWVTDKPRRKNHRPEAAAFFHLRRPRIHLGGPQRRNERGPAARPPTPSSSVFTTQRPLRIGRCAALRPGPKRRRSAFRPGSATDHTRPPTWSAP